MTKQHPPIALTKATIFFEFSASKSIRIGLTETQLTHAKTLIDRRVNRFKATCQTEIDIYGAEDITSKNAVVEGCLESC